MKIIILTVALLNILSVQASELSDFVSKVKDTTYHCRKISIQSKFLGFPDIVANQLDLNQLHDGQIKLIETKDGVDVLTSAQLDNYRIDIKTMLKNPFYKEGFIKNASTIYEKNNFDLNHIAIRTHITFEYSFLTGNRLNRILIKKGITAGVNPFKENDVVCTL